MILRHVPFTFSSLPITAQSPKNPPQEAVLKFHFTSFDFMGSTGLFNSSHPVFNTTTVSFSTFLHYVKVVSYPIIYIRIIFNFIAQLIVAQSHSLTETGTQSKALSLCTYLLYNHRSTAAAALAQVTLGTIHTRRRRSYHLPSSLYCCGMFFLWDMCAGGV